MRKIIILPALLVLILFNHAAFSQNDIETYTPPKLVEGNNLILATNPYFSAGKNTSINGESEEDRTYYNINANLLYTRWRYTQKFNYTVRSSLRTYLSKNGGILYLMNQPRYANDERAETDLGIDMDGGSNYYFFKNLIYAGVYTNFNYSVSNLHKPNISLRLYPAIGVGQIFNAARVNRTLNIQQVLIEEKIVTTPLPEKTRKKLTELLDKYYLGEFTSKYKDDSEIEFYTRVETILKEDGIISGTLNSRTVLKLFQALNNDNFLYFPNYKGCQFQAELEYLVNSYRRFSDANESKLYSLTLSGLYGLPIGIKNNFTGSVFFTIPLQPEYLGDFFDFNFHSPISLVEYNSSFSVPQFDAAYYNDEIKYAAGTKVTFYHLLNKTAALSFTMQGNYAKTIQNWDRSSYRVNASLLYNVLSKLRGVINLGASKNFYSVYNIYLSGGFSYYIF